MPVLCACCTQKHTWQAAAEQAGCCRELQQVRVRISEPNSIPNLTFHPVLAPSARPASAAKQSAATVCGSGSSAYARYGVLDRVTASYVLPLWHAPSRCPGAWRSGRPRGSARCSGGAATCGSPVRAPRFCAARALGVSNWGLFKGPGLHKQVESSSVLLSTALTLARRAWKQYTMSQLCTLHCCSLKYSAGFVHVSTKFAELNMGNFYTLLTLATLTASLHTRGQHSRTLNNGLSVSGK